MKKYILIICLVVSTIFTTVGQNISGTVTDQNGNPVSGAKVSVVNTPSSFSITDANGLFTLNTDEKYIEINYADRYLKRTWVNDDDIVLSDNDLMVATSVAENSIFNSTQSVTTISSKQLAKNESNSVQATFEGLIVGANGRTIRGIGSALQIVDGFERTISNINPEDVESVTVLKDGAALTLYGVRGANGVIIVNTKHGSYNSFEVEIDYKHGQQYPINMPQMLDAASYAKAINEALYYDNYFGVDAASIPEGVDPLFSRYSQEDINHFKNGTGDGDLYPNVNWLEEGLRDNTYNNKLDVTFRGGGKRVRYYTNLNYQNYFGLLNPEYTELSGVYNSQSRSYNLSVRTNLDIDVTNSTLLKIGMQGRLVENASSKTSYGSILGNLYSIPAAAFPIYTSSGAWGGDDIYKKNPVAQMSMNGYYKTNMRMLRSNLRLIQDLSQLVPGLKAEVAVAFDNNATYLENGTQNYAYEINKMVFNPDSGFVMKQTTEAGINGALSINTNGLSNQYMRVGYNANLSWNRTFGESNISAIAQYRQESYIPNGTPTHRQYLAILGSYNYANKYMVDIAVNHSGSSVLPVGQKFRTYPAISAAWMLSKEDFLADTENVNLLKLRASFGSAGYDAVPNLYMDKQYWVGGTGYTFGDQANKGTGGLKEGVIANDNFSIIKDTKYNIAVDAQLFEKLSLTAEAYYTQRHNMYVPGGTMISEILGLEVPQVNEGGNNYKGVELSVLWEESSRDFNYYIGANTTLWGSEIIENGEGFKPHDYLYKKGNMVNQRYGLEAEGFFNSWDEINNAPTHLFSEVRPGDIRYKDQNDDDQIDDYDVVPIGGSTTPLLYGGVRMGIEYKGFGIDAVFTYGTKFDRVFAGSHVYQPLRNNNNISTWYMDENTRWTENTKESANLPRLSTMNNPNNYRSSTQWLVDGSFLKLSNISVHYNLPESLLNPIKMQGLQIYVAANDLFSLDKIKYESVAIPELQSIYAGIKVKF